MVFRLDLHVHTRASHDARGSLLEVARAAAQAGLHGFAVTDHDAVADRDELRAAAEATGLLLVHGSEVTTTEGHLLAFGIRRALPKGLGMAEAVEAVADQGGVAAPSHPLRTLTGVGPTELRRHVAAERVWLAEGVNARERRIVQSNTHRLLDALGLAMVGGSDAHWVHDVGAAWTRFEEPMGSEDEVLEALRRGHCVGEGGSLPRRKVWAHGLSLPLRAVMRRT